ncbi:hypothetical protein KR067_005252, partial [Drosophila pandora]
AKSKELKIKPGTKEENVSAQHYPPCRIPKNVMQRTLTIATDPTDAFWLNINVSCTPSTSYEMTVDAEYKRSPTYEKLQLARNCLMQRDYKNLAKLLTSHLYGETILQKNAHNIFAEYASLLQKFTKLKQKTAQGVSPSPDIFEDL